MTIQNIEKQLLKLDALTRAKIAHRLLESLDVLTERENEKLWVEEALHRHNEVINGKAKSRNADAVFKTAKARLK